tara:strand:+ start:6131 stop:7987 length:1857 start_codon:yes stop_codon:yes gene_type:complete
MKKKEFLDMKTTETVNKNIEFIEKKFPNCVIQGPNGKAIDFDLLKQELSNDVIEGNKERYRLEWPGKREAIITANLPTTKTLRPVREDSVDFDNTENLYIEGDNLDVLKLLQESYLSKIKMIYIDPPYNTGKDFIYKDNFSKDAQQELLDSGQKDKYNQRLVANPETVGRYHSDWLNMMYPRLKLAKNLLRDDGVIFISIDDNEVHNLRKICDEIFGEDNFVAKVVWQRAFAPKNDNKHISAAHDFLLAYSKNYSDLFCLGLPRDKKNLSRYTNPDNDKRGPWQSSTMTVANGTDDYFYEITTPGNKKVLPPNGRYWVYNKKRYEELVDDNRIWFGKDNKGVPRIKTFLSEVKQRTNPLSVWSFEDVGHSQGATQELKKLFGGKKIFDNPKPVDLIKRILDLYTKNDDIILDFFSGSGTTAHATLNLNAKDGGNRKFIQVQLEENTDQKSIAFKSGYKTLTDIGKDRIRRAAKKIKEETGADIDYGFRVYYLDSSNMEDIFYKPHEYNQKNLDLFAENIKPDRTPDDLFTQIMLNWGLELSSKIEMIEVCGKQVFKVSENSFYACLDKDIDENFVKEISKENPLIIVFKDSGFKDDNAKTNVMQLFKQLSSQTKIKVI